MKKVKVLIMAFILLASSNINAQIDPAPVIPPGSGEKTILAGTLSGPTDVNCGDIVTYTFSPSPGSGASCSSTKWTVYYQDGSLKTFSGKSISINTGSTNGIIVLSAYAKSCTNSYEYKGGKQVYVGTTVARPSTLDGSGFLCNSTSSSYTVSAVSGATNYTFTAPTGWKINGVSRTSFTTISRTVSITAPSSGRGTGQIGVRANRTNACGSASSSYRTKTITYGTQSPSITSSSTTVGTNSILTLTASGINLSNFSWIVPSGWSVVTGSNSSVLIVTTGNTSGSFYIEVKAKSCDVVVGKSINITVTGGGGGFLRTTQGNDKFVDSETINANNLEMKIAVYPNPVSDKLQLTVPDEATRLASISLINMSSGKQILYQKMNDDSSVDLSNIKDGIYLLDMTTLNGKRIQKKIQVAH